MWRPDLFFFLFFLFFTQFPTRFPFFVCSIPTIFFSYTPISVNPKPDSEIKDTDSIFFFFYLFTQTHLPSITCPVSLQTALLILFVDLRPSDAVVNEVNPIYLIEETIRLLARILGLCT